MAATFGMAHTVRGIVAHLLRVTFRWDWLLPAIPCLALAYAIEWQRGRYLDDYYYQVLPVWLSHYPVRMVVWALPISLMQFYPDYELVLRVGLGLLVGANALLLGSLMYRLLGSRIGAVCAVWLSISPFWGFEAILWLGQAGYIVAVTASLLFLHWSWSAMTQPRRMWRWLACASVAFLVVLSSVESGVALVGLLPLFGLIAAGRAQSPAKIPNLMARATVLVLLPLVMVGVFYLSFYRSSWVLAHRGGLDTDPITLIARVEYFLRLLHQHTIGTQAGLPLASEVLRLGLAVLSQNAAASLLALAAAGFVVVVAVRWTPDSDPAIPSLSTGAVLVVAGVFWLFATYLLPASLARDQVFVYRLLYLPWCGLVVALAALTGMVSRLLPPRPWQAILTGFVGLVMLGASIGMLGFARVFSARAALDARQAALLRQALPSEDIPHGAYLIYLRGEENPLPGYEQAARTLVGGFESSLSATQLVVDAYGRDDVLVVRGSRYTRYRTRSIDGVRHLHIDTEGASAVIDDVPVAKTLAFTFRNGQAHLIQSMIFPDKDGKRHKVEFELVEALAARGVPALEKVTPNRD